MSMLSYATKISFKTDNYASVIKNKNANEKYHLFTNEEKQYLN